MILTISIIISYFLNFYLYSIGYLYLRVCLILFNFSRLTVYLSFHYLCASYHSPSISLSRGNVIGSIQPAPINPRGGGVEPSTDGQRENHHGLLTYLNSTALYPTNQPTIYKLPVSIYVHLHLYTHNTHTHRILNQLK